MLVVALVEAKVLHSLLARGVVVRSLRLDVAVAVDFDAQCSAGVFVKLVDGLQRPFFLPCV